MDEPSSLETARAGLWTIGSRLCNPRQLLIESYEESDSTTNSFDIDCDDSHCVPIVMGTPRLMPHRRVRSFAMEEESVELDFTDSEDETRHRFDHVISPPHRMQTFSSSEDLPFFNQPASPSSSNSSYDWNSTILSSLSSTPLHVQPFSRSAPSLIVSESEEPLYIEPTERFQYYIEDIEGSEGRSEVIRNFYAAILQRSVPVPRLPTHHYKAGNKLDENANCAVCLEDFEEGEIIMTLPCLHRYHDEHISKWLAKSNYCPLCKASVIISVSSNNDALLLALDPSA